jgi:hypothetical protein
MTFLWPDTYFDVSFPLYHNFQMITVYIANIVEISMEFRFQLLVAILVALLNLKLFLQFRNVRYEFL